MDRAVWLATSQRWCFLELSIGKRCLLELRDKGFEISPGGKEGEKKKIAVSTNNLEKSATQSFQPNSEQLLLIVHASWLDFPSLLMQNSLDFSKGGASSSLLYYRARVFQGPVCRLSRMLGPVRHQYAGSLCLSQAEDEGPTPATRQRVAQPATLSFL